MVICAAVLLLLGFTYTYTDHQLTEAQRAREALDTCEFLMRTMTQTTAKLWTAGNFESANEQQILNSTKVKVREKIQRLKDLCKDNPEQHRTVFDLEEVIESSFKLMQRSIEMKAERGIAPALKIMGFQISTQEQADNLFFINRRLTEQLTSSLKNSEHASTAETMRPLLLFATILIVSIGAITAFILNRSVVNRLSKLALNSKRLARLDQLVPSSTDGENDEIADLDDIFHTMAASLSDAIERERATIEKAADVIGTVNSRGEIRSVNSACMSAWGYQPGELIGGNLLELVQSNDRSQTRAFLANLKNSSEMETLENKLTQKDGSLLDILWTFRKSDTDDEIFFIAHDMTARKKAQDDLRKSEDRFAAIKEKMPAGIIIFSEDGIVLDYNPSAVTLLGRDQASLKNTRLGNIIPALASELNNLSKQKLPHEAEIIQSDGSVKTADLIVEELDQSEDKKKQYLAVLIDTTERNEFERIKETLVAMIAHDIATPMTTIHSQLHLAQLGAMGQLTEEGALLVHAAESQSVELMNVLTTVMKTAKYKHSTISRGITETNLGEIVDAVVESTESEQQQKNIDVHLQIDRSLRLLVEPDSSSHAIKVVLLSLLRSCPEHQFLTIESFFDEEANDGKFRLRLSHPRQGVVEPPQNLAWEFACAILQANNGQLRFIEGQKFAACEFEFKTG